MRQINFIKYIPFYFGLSAIVIGVGLAAVDFVGGALIQIRIEEREGTGGKEGPGVTEGSVREALAEVDVDAHSVQSAGENGFVIRTKSTDSDLRSEERRVGK